MKREIETKKIKDEMMELWKDTFHDSSRYIKLVFDTYFKPENVFTVYSGDLLIAALLGVEYYFQIDDVNEEKTYLKGLYLCGLATHPAFRKRGIMSGLMEEAERKAKERGYDLTFLIPANSHLREYYERKGYKTASYKYSKFYKNENFEEKRRLYNYTFQDFLKRGNFGFITEIAQWCSNIEKRSVNDIVLLHSVKDMMAIIQENENSFFLTDSSFDPEFPILTKVKAVVFPKEIEDKLRHWVITRIYHHADDTFYTSIDPDVGLPNELLYSIKKIQPDLELVLDLPYSGKNKRVVDLSPYAMIKPLGKDKLILNENRVFNISLMLD